MAGQEEARESERVRRLCERYVGLLARELERPTTRTTLDARRGAAARPARARARGPARPSHRKPRRGRRAQAALRRHRSLRASASAPTARTRPTGPTLPAIAARRAERWFGRVPSGPEVVIIGDTPADIHCGTGISARAVAVATGGYSVAELAACGPHAVFEDLSDTERGAGGDSPVTALHRELELKAVVPDPGAAPPPPPRGGRRAAVRGPDDRRPLRSRRRADRCAMRCSGPAPTAHTEGGVDFVLAWKGPTGRSPDGYKLREEIELSVGARSRRGCSRRWATGRSTSSSARSRSGTWATPPRGWSAIPAWTCWSRSRASRPRSSGSSPPAGFPATSSPPSR